MKADQVGESGFYWYLEGSGFLGRRWVVVQVRLSSEYREATFSGSDFVFPVDGLPGEFLGPIEEPR